MSVRRAPYRWLLLLAALAATISGCGEAHPLHADTEGIYLDLGALHYQVQLSRQLNPRDPEDTSYLEGLAPADAHLGPGQAFFGVWMRVENHSGQDVTPAREYRITDTQGNTFSPIVPDRTNQFAYRTLSIPGHGQIPDTETPAYNGPIQGALVLFKVTETSYDNRPLVLSITDPQSGQMAKIDLDV